MGAITMLTELPRFPRNDCSQDVHRLVAVGEWQARDSWSNLDITIDSKIK
jgi:hypothetical protein